MQLQMSEPVAASASKFDKILYREDSLQACRSEAKIPFQRGCRVRFNLGPENPDATSIRHSGFMTFSDLSHKTSQHLLLDLQDEIKAAEPNPRNIDKIIRGITDIGARLIDNRVNYILKAKDVLILDQKKTVIADDINDVKRLFFIH